MPSLPTTRSTGGLLTATAVLYMVPTVVLYLFARRYLLKATVTRALKG